MRQRRQRSASASQPRGAIGSPSAWRTTTPHIEQHQARRRRAGRLVDAATVARLLGVSRATVYANADQLGGIRLGNGKRARLRFDPARLDEPRSSAHRTARPRRRSARSSETKRLLPTPRAAPGAKRRRRGAQRSS
jgi:hypothetical protein